MTIPNAICLHEEDAGIAWKHTDYRTGQVEVRRSRRLVLSTIAFGWIALGSLSGVLGFLPLFVGENADTIALPPTEGPLKSRTALLFPVHHETPSRIAGTIQAIAFELQSMGRTPAFDVFILSDTRGEADGKSEERAYSALARSLQSIIPVYYRRRRENRGRKSGNIKDWVSRFGGAYEHFVILDGDSVMSGTTLVRLALAMQRDEKAGLIQTVPRLTGAVTLLQYLQQFASNALHDLVGSGRLSLPHAQHIEARNWVKAYRLYVGGTPTAIAGPTPGSSDGGGTRGGTTSTKDGPRRALPNTASVVAPAAAPTFRVVATTWLADRPRRSTCTSTSSAPDATCPA